jgi:hypothetical protein
MAQQQSPWLESSYGWNFGEGGWNSGMDNNLLKFSFMFDRNVDSVVASLPPAINGQAHYLTTDNRLYFAVGSTYFSTVTPKWFEFKDRSTGNTYQFNGTSAVLIDSPSQLDSRLASIELTVTSLGSAAFEDVAFFATQSELDIVEANSQAYTDQLKFDIASAAGSGLVGWERNFGDISERVVGKVLSTFPHSIWEFADLVVSKPNPTDPATWDWTPAIQGGIDALSAAGGGELRLYPGRNFPFTGLTMKEAVVLNGMAPRMNGVMLFATGARWPGAKLIYTGSSDAITFPSNAYGAAIVGLALNCDGQTAGSGIVLDDAAGVLRPGQLVRDVLVYRAVDRGVKILAGNREARFERVFVRGGDDATSRRTSVGWDNSSVDCVFTHCWAGFCNFRGIAEKGGASRYDNIDVWSSGGRGVEITGSSSDWYRLQTDGCEGAGLEITGGDDINLFGYVSLNNCASVSEYDVEITGDSRSVNFIAPKMRGAGAASLGAFRENTKSHVQVRGARIATGYTERFSDRARAYWSITDASNPVRPWLPSLVVPVQKNDNPYFADYSGSAPVGWAVRNGGSAVLRTVDLPTEALTGTTITSSATGTSGIQIDLTAELAHLTGRRIRVRGMFKGDGTSAANDQRIQIQDGVSNPIEVIPNNATWEYIAIDHRIPLNATVLQIRLVAANGTTAGKVLAATGVSVEFY